MNPTEKNYFKDYIRAFSNLSDYALSNRSQTPLRESVYWLTHGKLCQYTKDLLDALVGFRNRFEEGKPYILKDIAYMESLLESEKAKGPSDPSEYEEIKKLVSNLRETYDAVCNLVKSQDFTHLWPC